MSTGLLPGSRTPSLGVLVGSEMDHGTKDNGNQSFAVRKHLLDLRRKTRGGLRPRTTAARSRQTMTCAPISMTRSAGRQKKSVGAPAFFIR